MDITITVPDEMQDQINSWKDGEDYDITINQTAAGQFTLVSVNDDPSEDTEPADNESGEMNPGGMNDTAGTTIPTKNPAVTALIMSKKNRK